jgi:hypothetical protein
MIGLLVDLRIAIEKSTGGRRATHDEALYRRIGRNIILTTFQRVHGILS